MSPDTVKALPPIYSVSPTLILLTYAWLLSMAISSAFDGSSPFMTQARLTSFLILKIRTVTSFSSELTFSDGFGATASVASSTAFPPASLLSPASAIAISFGAVLLSDRSLKNCSYTVMPAPSNFEISASEALSRSSKCPFSIEYFS